MTTDQAHAFLTRWLQLAPDDAPQPIAEYHFYPARQFRCDWMFLEARLIVEIDGGQYKQGGGSHNKDTDRWRSNYAAIAGYRIMRFSTQMLDSDPQQCVDQVMMALGIEIKP